MRSKPQRAVAPAGLSLVLLVFGTSVPRAASAPRPRPEYSVTVLPPLPGHSGCYAWGGINRAGAVAGVSFDEQGRSTAVVWDRRGCVHPLPRPAGEQTDASAINDLGQVAGSAWNEGVARAVLWKDGRIIKLGGLPGTSYSYATALNDLGQVAGGSDSEYSDEHAVLWDEEGAVDLGTLGGDWSWAYAINEGGQVVGESETPAGDRHGFVWSRSGMTDLPPLPGDEWSEATGINDAGLIVGASGQGYDSSLVVWDRGVAHVLAESDFVFSPAINERGVIAGSLSYFEGPVGAFVWKNGRLQGLNQLLPAKWQWAVPWIQGLNDRGQIAGSSWGPGVPPRAYRLEPRGGLR